MTPTTIWSTHFRKVDERAFGEVRVIRLDDGSYRIEGVIIDEEVGAAWSFGADGRRLPDAGTTSGNEPSLPRA